MNTQSDREIIQALAHRLWEERGRPLGSAEHDWLEAEKQLRNAAATPPESRALDESIKQSFPASDPTATCSPDEPPANAEAKWAAAGVDREELARNVEADSQEASVPPARRAQSQPRRLKIQ
jgi:hypothetical protein